MDFLALTVELQSLAIGASGPSSVSTATGIEARFVNYIRNAWIDIQAHPKKWKWMWGRYEAPTPGGAPLQTVLNTREYLLSGVQSVRVNSFKSYLTVTGVTDRQRMTWTPWQSYDRRYGVIQETASRPIQVSRQPNGDLVVYPKPDDIYSIEFEYFKRAQVLTSNTDEPEMPSDFHMLIVYEAIKRFGKAENAPELIKLGEEAAGSDGNENRPVSGLWRALTWDQEFKDADTEAEDVHMVVRTQMEPSRFGGNY